jgi:hypothetical protein
MSWVEILFTSKIVGALIIQMRHSQRKGMNNMGCMRLKSRTLQECAEPVTFLGYLGMADFKPPLASGAEDKDAGLP